MSKAFTRETDNDADDDGEDPSLPPLPAGTRNYMTPQGYANLRAELFTLQFVGDCAGDESRKPTRAYATANLSGKIARDADG